MRYYAWQEVRKRIVDAQHLVMSAWRSECAKCGCTFWVYPQGVSNAQISKRVNRMAVRLYVVGLSYGAVESVLNSFMDCWNLWPRLTFYRTWKDEYGNLILDGANDDCERGIGWWIKERYRSMRCYKQEQSALGVSRLLAAGGLMSVSIALSTIAINPLTPPEP